MGRLWWRGAMVEVVEEVDSGYGLYWDVGILNSVPQN